jgi:hypothetical protein
MSQDTFNKTARIVAINFAREYQRTTGNITDGAIVVMDTRVGFSAELATAGLEHEGATPQEAKQRIAKLNADAKRAGTVATLAAWYGAESLLGLLSSIGADAKEIANWLSAPPPITGGFFRLVIMSGGEVSFDVLPISTPADA